MIRLVLVALLCGLVVACSRSTFLVPERETVSLKPVSFDDLPGWSQDSLAAAVPAFLRSCRVFLRQPETRNVGNGQLTAGMMADWCGPCRAAERLSPGDDEAARRFFESWFEPLQVVRTEGEEDGLFTGYYEVELAGSLVPTGPYRTPLLGKPSDLVTVDLGQFWPELKDEVLVGRVEGSRLRPYPDRARIEAVMATATVKPDPDVSVIAWVRDPIEAFLLHIQGSGLVRLADGTFFRVGYAADNGHKFVSIAQRLIERGWIARNQASMNAVRDWLRDHPDQARTVMAENPRFIRWSCRCPGRAPDGRPQLGHRPALSAAGRAVVAGYARARRTAAAPSGDRPGYRLCHHRAGPR
ncbi:MAG: membrane-bound lytic murein transglycosylase A [Rhodospirillaceae bacterium]|nr:MAG: membrane-bound lytic murein transglycosylase A [Rhodospirillaceae bacterium]